MAITAETHRERQNRIFDVAKANYHVLVQCCDRLSEGGYWTQAESVLHRSIYEILDLYLQSVLICMASFGHTLREAERHFILALPYSQQYELPMEESVSDSLIEEATHFMQTPPIILQLCGLHDKEGNSDLSLQYFDAFLNILVAMSWMNENRSTDVIRFIKNFYNSVETFLIAEDRNNYLNERYLFRKVSGDPELPGSFRKQKDHAIDFQEDENNLSCAESNEESEVKHKDALEQLLEELHSLVGLKEVKSEIQSLINLIKIRNLRQEHGLPSMDMSYHMVFTGNPGTGKTTVARLVASIYKELGLLSKGTLFETDRSGLVAGYVGQTALKVKEVVDQALGGVLFIDEAYSLAPESAANDFGSEAIDTLVKLMEDNRDDLVVIVAGYTEEMKRFLASNTGLVSRFNKFIEFQDYSDEELSDIFAIMSQKMQMRLTDEALEKLKQYFSSLTNSDKQIFGNARGVRNLFEKTVVCQANRLIAEQVEMGQEPDMEALSEIRWNDVMQALTE